MTTTDKPLGNQSRRVRWLPGVILLVLAPVCIIGTWFIAGAIADGDRTVQMVAGIVALSVAFLLQLIWWTFFARLTWRNWLIGVGCVAAIALVAVGTLRFTGHSGEMLPTGLRFVWQPTPEQAALTYFRDAAQQMSEPSESFTVVVSQGDWPEYRGPNRDGVVSHAVIRTDWADRPLEEVWRHPVGPGWSSFAVVGDLIFTQEQRGENEVVVCYHALRNGEQRWIHEDETRFSEALGGDGPRATPTVTDSKVYTQGATGLLNCLDAATGRLLWQRDILKDAGDAVRVANIDWGMAGSPLVWEGAVFVAPGGRQGKSVICYDAGTGEIRWATGDATASYAAPRIEVIEGSPHLLIFDGDGIKGYDPLAGQLLWSYGPWTNQAKVNAAQPIVQGNQVLISSGYTVGSALLEISRITDGWEVKEIWRNDNKFKLKFNDGVLHNGYVYGLDEGILACIEFSTGKQQWKRGRYGYGQVILLGETLVVLAEDGTLAAVEATPTSFRELSRVPVLDGKTWNHPAFAHGLLYVRNDREAACLNIGLDPLATSGSPGD